MSGQAESVQELSQTVKALTDNNKHGDAVKILSDALKTVENSKEQVTMLLMRSRAFTGMADWLRSIPASESEERAIIGLDPTALAQLGLNDARKAARLNPTEIQTYLQQGRAQALLEKYSEAEQAYLEGLAVDPLNRELQQSLRNVQQQVASRPSSPAPAAPERPKRRRASVAEDAECGLCMKLLFEPVTTPCGHSFCRSCFLRAIDHSSKCPMCRTILHVGREVPVTLALRQLIERSFPEEYEARRQEERGVEHSGKEAPLALFVMSCIFPNERMRLNIFEPRYRLMIRRCMEGSRRFGMALVTSDGRLLSTACEVEITECQPVPDGRYLLEIKGKRRFRLDRFWEQDGYRVGQPAYFQDEPVDPASEGAAQLSQMAAQVVEKTDALLARLSHLLVASRGAAASPRRASLELLDLLGRAGERPAAHELEKLSFWVANLLPMDTQDRLRMLGMTSTAERLSMELRMLEGGVEAQACTVA